MVRYAYVHGFASGPFSAKGQRLRAAMERRGAGLAIPDLNRPSFARLTATGALEGIDELVAAAPDEARWRFVGSSFGGFVAARWAELHPRRVDRLVLLCPGFDLPSRWPDHLGAEQLAAWRERGWTEVDDGQGNPVRLHWGFFTDVQAHPGWPESPCPTLVVHGRRDEVVPIATSRTYAARHPQVRLLEVDDDHSLLETFDRWEPEALDFLTAAG